MARPANTALLARIRNLRAEVTSLALELKDHGDHEAAGYVERAKREIELAERQGTFKSRGQSI